MVIFNSIVVNKPFICTCGDELLYERIRSLLLLVGGPPGVAYLMAYFSPLALTDCTADLMLASVTTTLARLCEGGFKSSEVTSVTFDRNTHGDCSSQWKVRQLTVYQAPKFTVALKEQNTMNPTGHMEVWKRLHLTRHDM